MTTKAYSFDIFDTCLTRVWTRPTDLFYELANRLKNNGSSTSPEYRAELASLRIDTELQLKKNANKGKDVTLNDIWEVLKSRLPTDISVEALMQTELDLEYEHARPILATKLFIRRLRERNARIIFISDMYLPESFLKKLLVDSQIASENDPVYVSGDIGLTKASSALYQYVLEKEQLPPQALHHYGDNLHSDVIVPRKLGIAATHFKDSQLNRYEKALMAQPQDDIQTISRITGISRAVRLMCESSFKSYKGLATLISNVVAPLFTSYVAWAIKDAAGKNIKRLYFVSRDGLILLKIAERIAPCVPNAPECRYLYGSRQAWFLPSITEINRKSLLWLIQKSSSATPRDVFKTLHIGQQEIEPVLFQMNITNEFLDAALDKETSATLWQVIEHQDIVSIIQEKAQKARKQALAYFEQEGLCSDEKWAIVDIGWYLNCQGALRKILLNIGKQDHVYGYYFCVRREAHPIAKAGPYAAFLRQDPSYLTGKNPVEQIFRKACIIDQIFTVADHGLVLGYKRKNGRMAPVLKDSDMTRDYLDFVEIIFGMVRIYADETGKAGLLNDQIHALKQCAITSSVNFFLFPDKFAVNAIAGRQTSYDSNESRTRPVARKLTIRDLIYFSGYYSNMLKERDFAKGFEWFEGSVALSAPWIQALFALFNSLKQSQKIKQSFWVNKLLHSALFSNIFK